jgi:NAD(P)-dependent dehydrogenase (short-subunit alcohol dehydrogenase family)
MDNLAALSGGTIVVTGAGSGIGEGVARTAAELGMNVVLADIHAERAEGVARSLRQRGATALVVPTDVRDPESLESLARAAFDAFGEVRILVNNAGVEATGYSWEQSAAQLEAVISVNLFSLFHGLRAFIPRLRVQGTPSSIVNLSSIAALSSGPPQQSAYNASKHGVQALSECLYLELQEIGVPISVHVVNPGPVSTRIFTHASAAGAAAVRSRDVLGTYVGEHGLTGLQAGRIILEGVNNGEFWIRTHPDMQEDAIARRTQMLARRTPPELVSLAAPQTL